MENENLTKLLEASRIFYNMSTFRCHAQSFQQLKNASTVMNSRIHHFPPPRRVATIHAALTTGVTRKRMIQESKPREMLRHIPSFLTGHLLLSFPSRWRTERHKIKAKTGHFVVNGDFFFGIVLRFHGIHQRTQSDVRFRIRISIRKWTI